MTIPPAAPATTVAATAPPHVGKYRIYHNWEDVKDIIARNALEDFRRDPEYRTLYRQTMAAVAAEHGGVTEFLCRTRLGWPIVDDLSTTCANETLFADPRDYKILLNDWPYGVTPDITHLCVWLKNSIPLREADADMTDEARVAIEAFVQKTFVVRLQKELPAHESARDRVRWFKNWSALQSVRGIPHIHVLMHDVPQHVLAEWLR